MRIYLENILANIKKEKIPNLYGGNFSLEMFTANFSLKKKELLKLLKERGIVNLDFEVDEDGEFLLRVKKTDLVLYLSEFSSEHDNDLPPSFLGNRRFNLRPKSSLEIDLYLESRGMEYLGEFLKLLRESRVDYDLTMEATETLTGDCYTFPAQIFTRGKVQYDELPKVRKNAPLLLH